MDIWSYLAVGGAAFVGGVMNAISGGGTLLTFPTLLAIGVPPVAANVTNTVALTPGYLSGALAQRRDLTDQRDRLKRLVPPTVIGGAAGAALLLVTNDDTLRLLIPILIGIGTLMLALSNRIKTWLGRSSNPTTRASGSPLPDARWLTGAITLAGVYGGYFGAGVGVMLLAILGIGVHQPLNKSNAVKQVLSFATNLTAAIYFTVAAALGHGRIRWDVAAVMALGSIVGGNLGGRIAGRLDPNRFRLIVVVIGSALTCIYAARIYL